MLRFTGIHPALFEDARLALEPKTRPKGPLKELLAGQPRAALKDALVARNLRRKRIAAIRRLGESGTAQADEIIGQAVAVRDPDDAIRREIHAQYKLIQSRPHSFTSPLDRAPPSAELGSLPQTIAHHVSALFHPQAEVRRLAAKSLDPGRTRCPHPAKTSALMLTAAYLASAMRDPSQSVREQAITALYNIHKIISKRYGVQPGINPYSARNTGGLATLGFNGLHHKKPLERLEAAARIAKETPETRPTAENRRGELELPNAHATLPLLFALYDPDPRVRLAAAVGLARIGHPTTMLALNVLGARETDERTKETLQTAMELLILKNPRAAQPHA